VASTHGISIAFEDLLIGGTALHLGYSVATLNARHFRLISSLSVFSFEIRETNCAPKTARQPSATGKRITILVEVVHFDMHSQTLGITFS
jgi:hypothetical protein